MNSIEDKNIDKNIDRIARMPVLMSIRGVQAREGEEPDVTELLTDGIMELTQEGISLTYEESSLTGMDGTTTTFLVQSDRIILSRVGTVNSQMVFEEGRQHTSLYETPYGDLAIDIQTDSLRNHLSEQGGTVEIQYTLVIEHNMVGCNSFLVRVRRKSRNTTPIAH